MTEPQPASGRYSASDNLVDCSRCYGEGAWPCDCADTSRCGGVVVCSMCDGSGLVVPGERVYEPSFHGDAD